MTLFDDGQAPITYTRDMKLRAVAREIKQREHVYPRLVEQGTMSPKKHNYELGVMRAIEADYSAPALTDRQVELIRLALCDRAEKDDTPAEEIEEFKGINDRLRDLQR